MRSLLGGFVSPSVLMYLPTLLFLPFLISQLGEQRPARYPSGSKHLINAQRMMSAIRVHILGERKENGHRMFCVQHCCFGPLGASGFLPICFFTCVRSSQVRHMTALHTTDILGPLVTAKKDLIGPCMLIPGQSSRKMRNLFLSHLFWS